MAELTKIMKTLIRIAGVQAKIQTKHLPNTSPEHYLQSNPFGRKISLVPSFTEYI
jgi:hypothetical protein